MASEARLSPRLRPARTSLGAVRGTLLRPEFTAVVSVVIVFVYFAVAGGGNGFLTETSARNVLEVTAAIGIIAAPVTLLLVAGEFDISVGAIVGASQILFSYAVVFEHWPVWQAALFTLAVCGSIGLINGLLSVKTPVPSFIVTLGAFYWVRGTAQGGARIATDGTTVSGVHDASDPGFFLSIFSGSSDGYSVAILWFVVVIALAAWILHRTPVGNRIYATGGNLDAARRAGVACDRIKIALFICSALAAALVGILTVYQIDQGNVAAGQGLEFQTVTAAVIGGAAIFGGFGSPIGMAIGALMFGMVNQGFFFTNIPDEWFQTFLGVILVVAVLVNERTRALLLRPRSRS